MQMHQVSSAPHVEMTSPGTKMDGCSSKYLDSVYFVLPIRPASCPLSNFDQEYAELPSLVHMIMSSRNPLLKLKLEEPQGVLTCRSHDGGEGGMTAPPIFGGPASSGVLELSTRASPVSAKASYTVPTLATVPDLPCGL